MQQHNSCMNLHVLYPKHWFLCYLFKMYSIHVVKKHVLQLFKTIKLILLLKAKFEKLFFVDYNFKAHLNRLYDNQFKPVLENSFSCCYWFILRFNINNFFDKRNLIISIKWIIFEVVVSITIVSEQTNYRNALTRDIQFLYSPDGSYWHRIE